MTNNANDTPVSSSNAAKITFRGENNDGASELEQPSQRLDLHDNAAKLLGILKSAQNHLQSAQQLLCRLTAEPNTNPGDQTPLQSEASVSLQPDSPVNIPVHLPPGPYIAEVFRSVTPRGDIRVAVREHFNALLWRDGASRNYRVPWKSLTRNLLKSKRRFTNWPSEIQFKSLTIATLRKSEGAKLLLEVEIEDWTADEILRSRKKDVPLIVSTYGNVLLRAGDVMV